MPETDPAYYDAIDEVVDTRKDDAEWDEDEMRSALMEVARGESQESAAEDRSFSQPLVSKRWKDVEAVYEEIRQRQEGGSGLFKNPLEEAIEEFEGFFDEVNDKYEMGINGKTIQMMVDEIRDAQQLPAPAYVGQFLKNTNSGVAGADADYVQRRYEQWVNRFQEERQGAQGMPGGMSSFGGQQIQQQRSSQTATQGGVPVGQQPQMGGGQRGQPQQHPQGQQQAQQEPRDPRVDELMEEFEEIKAWLAEMGQEEEQNQQMVTIEEEGRVIEMPMEQAMQMGYIGDNGDDEDFLDKMAKMKEAGLIPDHDSQQDDEESLVDQIKKLRELGIIDDNEGDEMAGAIGEAIESLGEKQMQAQQQMSQNFSNVLEQIRTMQETEDEDLGADDVRAIINDELKDDEVDRLERQLENMQSTFQNQLKEVKRSNTEGVQDTDFLKTDREMEFREKQMETLNENLRELPKQMSLAMREGFVPALKELQSGGPGSGNPLWSPPEGGARGEPRYNPSEPEPEPEPARQPEPQARQPTPEPEPAQPEPEPEPEPDGVPDTAGMAQEEPDVATEERGKAVREKLGLEDDDGKEAVEA